MINETDCPECGSRIIHGLRPLNGEIITCGICMAELEVVCTNPFQVELAPEVEEDWGE